MLKKADYARNYALENSALMVGLCFKCHLMLAVMLFIVDLSSCRLVFVRLYEPTAAAVSYPLKRVFWGIRQKNEPIISL